MREKNNLIDALKAAGAVEWIPKPHDPGDFQIGRKHFVLTTWSSEQCRQLRQRLRERITHKA
jgi:hypothetical protein